MLYYDRIDISKGIGPTQGNKGRKCTICHCFFFNHGFKFQDYLWNGCHDFTMLSVSINDIATIIAKNVDCRSIIHNISKSKAV